MKKAKVEIEMYKGHVIAVIYNEVGDRVCAFGRRKLKYIVALAEELAVGLDHMTALEKVGE